MNRLLRPSSGALIPLSEDVRLVLDSPRYLEVGEGEIKDWDEVTRMTPGQRRVISLDIKVAAGGQGRMVRVFEVPQGARLTILYKVHVAEGAHWRGVVCVRGRGEIVIRRAVEAEGQGASTSTHCIAVLEGSGRLSVADEAFPRAEETLNDLRSKVILHDTARSEVRGRIVVGENADASSAYERLDHLIFGNKATAAVVPELEVKTDNVKCGHGATTSRLDEEALFYLESRGLTTTEAQQFLSRAFVEEAFVGIPLEIKDEAYQVLFE